jgi:hypothetical protein
MARLEDNIEEIAIRVCDQVASAIERYAVVYGWSGLEDKPAALDDIPESFLRDYVFHGLGDVLTMTLETNNKTLWEWNADHRRRWNGEPYGRSASVPSQLEEFKNQKRPDLTIFSYDHTKKSVWDFICLVEIKKYWSLDPPPADLKRIEDWFRWLDTCPYGMLCATVKLPKDEHIKKLKGAAIAAGHQWITGRIARPAGIAINYQPFARILTNGNCRR